MCKLLYTATLIKCFLIQVKWRQICVFISLPVVYTQHWDCFCHCEGDNWLKKRKKEKANPSSHSTLLPFQSAAKMKSLISQRKDKKTLLVISLDSHNHHMLHALLLAWSNAAFTHQSFVFVCKMLSHLSGKESFPLVLFSLFRLQASLETLNAYQLTSFKCNI